MLILIETAYHFTYIKSHLPEEEEKMKRLSIVLSAIIICISFTPAFAEMPGYAELTKLLVDISGWEASEATGMNMTGPMGEMVNAVREYEKDDMTISAQIIVGMAAQGAWAPFQAGYSIDTPETSVKTMDISGYRVGISHEKKEKSGGIVVLLPAEGTSGIFTLAYEGMSSDEALDIAKKFSWKSIEEAIK